MTRLSVHSFAHLLAAAFLFLNLGGVAHADTDAAFTKQVNAFVDEWHDDAANARMAYFDKIAKDGVYIGTDRTELWRRDEFKAWAKKYFDRKSAWSFKATRRNVYASGDKSLIWFDELLDTPNMGPCMASGVIRKTAKGFEIVHYQLSMAVPNEVADKVTRLIAEHEKAGK
ncbi:nuclear transport factor 2 family protein [Massilia consociata]|uniref:Nuclear transport factor 2 family protein n=1 Tax=Massilia consociata TaxID=760117 RepID=A0ABV6FJA9_9BURK